jgi:hypothetical protein
MVYRLRADLNQTNRQPCQKNADCGFPDWAAVFSFWLKLLWILLSTWFTKKNICRQADVNDCVLCLQIQSFVVGPGIYLTGRQIRLGVFSES